MGCCFVEGDDGAEELGSDVFLQNASLIEIPLIAAPLGFLERWFIFLFAVEGDVVVKQQNLIGMSRLTFAGNVKIFGKSRMHVSYSQHSYG